MMPRMPDVSMAARKVAPKPAKKAAPKAGRKVAPKTARRKQEVITGPLTAAQTESVKWGGVSAPMGYFDPAGFSAGASLQQLRTYREIELKHCRIAMLAALGFVVGETNPVLLPDIEGPAVYHLQQTLAQYTGIWGIPLTIIALLEIGALGKTFIPAQVNAATVDRSGKGTRGQANAEGEEPGLFIGGSTFDPLGLKPQDPEKLQEIKTKELNNGRLAMIGIAGLFTQEAITGEKIFGA